MRMDCKDRQALLAQLYKFKDRRENIKVCTTMKEHKINVWYILTD